MTLRVLNAEAVRRHLPLTECIPLMEAAFRLVADGRARQPVRQALRTPDGQGLLSMMPGYVEAPGWLGIKVVSVFPGNFGTLFGSHQGVVLLFDVKNGSLKAILDGREITAIRTAAATAVATDVLARRDAESLAIVGYGEQARTHLEALSQVRRFKTIRVWGRDPDRAEAFCLDAQNLFGLQVEVARSIEHAATHDVICLTTAASEPFFQGRWLTEGQHINVVGSSIPTTSEIDVETVVKSRVYVDFIDSARELAGDLRQALASGRVQEDHILGSIGDVLTSRVTGRRDERDITLFKSLGMISEDLLAADHVLSKAQDAESGDLVAW